MRHEQAQPDLEVTRTLAATPHEIWSAWLDPVAIARWWGPAGFTSTVRELDVRPGGRFDVVMRAPDGTEFPNVYVIEQVEPGRRIVWIHQGSEEHGLAPSRSSVEIVSVGAGPQSTVTLRAFYASEADRRRHLEDFHAAAGATQLLERLEQVAVAR